MTTLEILFTILAPLIALLIYLVSLLIGITSRLATLEANMKLLLQWVACLNGDMKTGKEFESFLKKLKKVNKENLCDE